MRKAFVTTAAIHVVNIKSIESLKREILQKYASQSLDLPELNFDYELFRPNIVIDYNSAYSEEEIFQSRI